MAEPERYRDHYSRRAMNGNDTISGDTAGEGL
jgi:hypothetical protein